MIVTRNEIVQQWIDEAAKFYGGSLPVHRVRTRQAMRDWCRDGPGHLGITNYEKWNPEDLDHQIVTEAKFLTFIILDEGSRLRGSAGKQKWALIKSCRGIEYKYSLTATPAPNELMEFASQASFLEKMRSEGEIIWTYFLRDQVTHRWTVKPHARADFFRWMVSWSIYINEPKRFGWRLDQPEIPPPIVTVHPVPATQEQLGKLCELTADASGQMNLPGVCDTDLNVVRASRLSQAAKGFVYLKGQGGKYQRIASNKPKAVADIIRSEAALGLQVLVWTVFTAESELLAEQLGGVSFDLLNGRTKEKDREAILERFRTGQTPVLITLADMLGWGMNLQCCGSMVFSGWTFGFESYYQSVRRAYRYGQTKVLRVHIPVVQELEQEMLNTIFHKEQQHMASISEMEGHYLNARKEKRDESHRKSLERGLHRQHGSEVGRALR